MIVERFGLSERRARTIISNCSTKRHKPRRDGDRDDGLRERLRKLSAEHLRQLPVMRVLFVRRAGR